MRLQGAITALVTPFSKGRVDHECMARLVRWQISQGISGLVPLGTTGEAPTIEDDERTEIIKNVIAAVKGRVPVIVGTGTNCTKDTVRYSIEAERLGADAVLVVTPYYNKPTDEGIYRHFKEISDSIGIPIVAYNIAGRTGKNMDVSLMKRLAGLKNVRYVKEASCNMDQIMQMISIPGLTVLSGDDSFAYPVMAAGGKGVISVVSNLMPKQVSAMCDLALKGKLVEARKMHSSMMPIFKAAFIETNPIPIKEAMKAKGLIEGGYRLPLCEMQEANREKLRQVLRQMRFMR